MRGYCADLQLVFQALAVQMAVGLLEMLQSHAVRHVDEESHARGACRGNDLEAARFVMVDPKPSPAVPIAIEKAVKVDVHTEMQVVPLRVHWDIVSPTADKVGLVGDVPEGVDSDRNP